MKVADEDVLTIREIARRWASEGDALVESEICRRLWAAYCKGEFQSGRESSFGVVVPAGSKHSGFYPYKRRVLLGRFVSPKIDGSRALSKADLRRASHLPWGERDKIEKRISQDHVFYYENAAVTRQGLFAWCDRCRCERPAFWARSQELAPIKPTVQVADYNAEMPPARPSKRRSTVGIDANLKNRIETVKAAAKGRWPNPLTRPTPYAMARSLLVGQSGNKMHGFGQSAIKKILAGTYSVSKRLGIDGL